MGAGQEGMPPPSTPFFSSYGTRWVMPPSRDINEHSAPNSAAEEDLCKRKGTGVLSQPLQVTKTLVQTLMDPHEGQKRGMERGMDAEVTVNIFTQNVIPQWE